MSVIIDPGRILLQPVTVTYLEMHEPKAEPALMPEAGFTLLSKPVSVSAYRDLYFGVGKKWHWLDRMVMPDDELFEKINAGNVDIFVFKLQNETAGFVELVNEIKWVEIQYFGLMPAFTGKGWGKYFLQWAIAKAWSYGPKWIQLNTCTLDHPNALPVYLQAGFKIVTTNIQPRKKLVL